MTNPPDQYKKTRLAPTPSGFLHLGNVLSFSITAALAVKNGAKILLRIDDMDQPRVNQQYLQDIFDTLNFLEIPWGEGPRNVKEFEDAYSQLQRMNIYNDALTQLRDNDLVFACSCSRTQLRSDSINNDCPCLEKRISLTAENVSWRLITNESNTLEVKNYDGRIIRLTLPAEMKNFVIRRKDGSPSYQLTSVIDDLFYRVDLVVRGEDLWVSTLAQHELAKALGKNNFRDITFYHHPLLMEASGKKLSKSAGATSIRYLRENGKTPADIYTLIAELTGVNERVNNWQQLAGLLIKEV
ncbi:MAG TPA: glutamate--tRNA ligase family protein [Mucilaginibacter sp.]